MGVAKIGKRLCFVLRTIESPENAESFAIRGYCPIKLSQLAVTLAKITQC